ncbi:SOS response-associated peptidase [Labilibacter marinus]|uniref:SOS response-associated peptidase n=1 Tax=Labilibacter marinus TaxID=1477105 RepID=UPI0009501F7C|nr:SOS response-associated peptidase [Labilibacter marinus]
MCFTVKYITQKKLKYAKRRGDNPEEIAQIESQLDELTKGMSEQNIASGFTHPPLLVFKSQSPLVPELVNWGLIPHWIKDDQKAKDISNKTLNARGETIFEKPSFKRAANLQRCIVMVDGFYDYKHMNGKAYPYLIENEDLSPMVFAGIWDKCQTVNLHIHHTLSIVTTTAEGLVKEIHNNPKKKESRTPLILNKELESIWLNESSTKSEIQHLINNPVQFNLVAHQVESLR